MTDSSQNSENLPRDGALPDQELDGVAGGAIKTTWNTPKVSISSPVKVVQTAASGPAPVAPQSAAKPTTKIKGRVVD